MSAWQRTHTCDELRPAHVGQSATLNGWVLTSRDHNSQIFVDLKDRYGLTQVVFESDAGEVFAQAQALRKEFCVSVTGTVRPRLEGKERPDVATGAVELAATKLEVLNTCPALPFEINEFGSELANEDLRLEHRYLDLRRKSLQAVLVLRHRLCKLIRDFLDERGFLEVETPLLGKSTPEGARDYLVPSRITHGEFYALPQSPQLYKQLLMIAGYDKYFQIARCLRDEDLRSDRQPEFTQLDLEMSFVERDDILTLMETLAAQIVQAIHGVELALPFARYSYSDVMRRYGSDKPDLRFGLEIVDVTDLLAGSEFIDFKAAAEQGGKILALNAKGAGRPEVGFSRKLQDAMAKELVKSPAHKLALTKSEGAAFSGGVAKYLTPEQGEQLRARLAVEKDDIVVFGSGTGDELYALMGSARSYLAQDVLKLVANWWDEKAAHEKGEEKAAKKERRAPRPFVLRPEHFNFAWVVDFPMFAYDAEEKRHVAIHHPFTAPADADLGRLESAPGECQAKAYDLVLNGYEVGGGSIRIHRQDVQSRVFAMLGMSEDDARARFGFLLDALKSGAPPHGGIALGLDRWCMILAGTTNIRDVIAFPKNQKARDLMSGAPAAVGGRQLKDLGIKLG